MDHPKSQELLFSQTRQDKTRVKMKTYEKRALLSEIRQNIMTLVCKGYAMCTVDVTRGGGNVRDITDMASKIHFVYLAAVNGDQ